MRAVLTPMQEAIGRFCVTPRTNNPRRVRLITKDIAMSTAAAKAMITKRLYGKVKFDMT
jgi:hypothetical protein